MDPSGCDNHLDFNFDVHLFFVLAESGIFQKILSPKQNVIMKYDKLGHCSKSEIITGLFKKHYLGLHCVIISVTLYFASF